MIECDSSQEIEFIPLPPPPFEKGGCETVDKRRETSKKAVYIYIYIYVRKGKKLISTARALPLPPLSLITRLSPLCNILHL